MPVSAMKSVIPTLESRVGKLEGAVDNLISNFSHFSSEITNTVNRIAENQTSFQDGVRKDLTQANAPRWPLIVGVATFVTTILALAVTVLTIILSGQSGAVAITNHNVDRLQSRLDDLRYHFGKLETQATTDAANIIELKQWRLNHTEEDSKFTGTTQTKLDMLYDDYIDFRRVTANIRWTKLDQQDYEKRIENQLLSLRQELSCPKRSNVP